MLKLNLAEKNSSDKDVTASRKLIKSYLNTVVEEGYGYKSASKLKRLADGVTMDFSSAELSKVRDEDIAQFKDAAKQASKGKGVRAALNYYSRGTVQEIVSTAAQEGPREALRTTAKVLTGVTALATGVGAAAQATFGEFDYNRYFGQEFEQTAARFLFGAPDYHSVVPAVVGTAVALTAARAAVAYVAYPRTDAEKAKFDDYIDAKHAQVALRRLEKAVGRARKAEKEKTTVTPSALSQMLGKTR